MMLLTSEKKDERRKERKKERERERERKKERNRTTLDGAHFRLISENLSL